MRHWKHPKALHNNKCAHGLGLESEQIWLMIIRSFSKDLTPRNPTFNGQTIPNIPKQRQITIDHSMMDHSMMDHSMPEHDMPDMDMCSMNMIFTWDWKNTCVVFKWWHIRSFSSFVLSLVVIAWLAALYEFLRARAKRLDNKSEYSFDCFGRDSSNNGTVPSIQLAEEEHIITTNPGSITRVQKAVVYGALVGYSYLLMLVFMTYNGWFMLAITVGAGLGNYLFGTEFSETLACH